jgi:Tfp pilus assembly protein PilN
MRAVNLIPPESRRGGGAGAAGRSGGGAYVILGGLAVLVLLVGVWAVSGRGLSDKRAELAGLRQQAATAQAQASTLSSFSTFAQLRRTRSESVRSLAAARFDWARTLDAIARVMPRHVWLSGMTGSAGAAAPSATPAPPGQASIALTGCAPSHAAVARLMPRLRAVPGVATVSLSQATRADNGSAGGSESCSDVVFEITLGFAQGPATAVGTPAPPGTPAPAGTAAAAPAPAAGAAQ